MTKYLIEGNINFNEELYKLLDEDSDNEDELCQITGLPLKQNHIILECKHHFNYVPLYKEIYKQKYDFKTYDINSLTKSDYNKYILSNKDYFIRCPYCRNLQFSILPFYEESDCKPVYGINSLDKKFDNINIKTSISNLGKNYDQNYSFILFGKIFKNGICCNPDCNLIKKTQFKYVTNIEDTDQTYCRIHYKDALLKYKKDLKNKLILQKIVKKQEKELNKSEKKLELEKLNKERTEKGLSLLKRLPNTKNKINNIIVNSSITIGQFENIESTDLKGNNNSLCNIILKSGPKKGTQCGCKKFGDNNTCKRHLTIKEKSNN